MHLTDEEKAVLKRVLERLLAPPPPAKPQPTLRELREMRRKAAEDGKAEEG